MTNSTTLIFGKKIFAILTDAKRHRICFWTRYFNFYLSYSLSLPLKVKEVLANMGYKMYEPRPGFLFFILSIKGPVTNIYVLPSSNPNPFFGF